MSRGQRARYSTAISRLFHVVSTRSIFIGGTSGITITIGNDWALSRRIIPAENAGKLSVTTTEFERMVFRSVQHDSHEVLLLLLRHLWFVTTAYSSILIAPTQEATFVLTPSITTWSLATGCCYLRIIFTRRKISSPQMAGTALARFLVFAVKIYLRVIL